MKMRPSRWILTALAVVGVVGIVVATSTAARAAANPEELREIEKRAKTIETYLQDAPAIGARTAGLEYWRELGSRNGIAKRWINEAEKVCESTPQELTEELYKEYYRNGNRTHYQDAYHRVVRRAEALTMAEAFEGKGRFVEQLNKELLNICEIKSWVYPAHDDKAQVYDGKRMISDLGSTTEAAKLALAINLFEEKLDPAVVARVKEEIERRVLQPYEIAVKEDTKLLWWVRTVNNWNAVCHAGTVVAALNIVESKERRAFFLAAADYFSEKYFMQGFTDDGYCSEGMGYWNYGFGFYLYLVAAAREATGNKLDLFRFEKISAIIDYAPNQLLAADSYAVFADCSMTARPDAITVAYASRLAKKGYSEYEEQALGKNYGCADLQETGTIGLDKEILFGETSGSGEKFVAPMRSLFDDAGVAVLRPGAAIKKPSFVMALKGGHNGELHNHNDVGSYTLALAPPSDKRAEMKFVSRDPGGEVYTARTFSSRRYEGQLLNSFGHPVPRIAGTLQTTGSSCAGKRIDAEYTDAVDRLKYDVTTAYKDANELKSATREFRYERPRDDFAGRVAITDDIRFNEGKTGAIETALITFYKDVKIDASEPESIRVDLDGATATITARDANGASLKLVAETAIVGENDESARSKPTRVALRVDGDVNAGIITTVFDAK